MKKRLFLLLPIFLLCLFLFGCAEEGSMDIVYGERAQIQLEKAYENLTWESSDSSIVTVENGSITGKAPGQVVITAKQETKTVAEYTVNVSIIEITDIFLQSEELTLKVDEAATLNYTLFPTDASKYGISYTSINPEIAKVDEDGNITAIAPGNTKIVVSTQDGVTANCSVVVASPSALELLNDNELRVFTYLTESGLRSFYNASAVRLRGIYTDKVSLDVYTDSVPPLVTVDIQGTNKLGGTLYKFYGLWNLHKGTNGVLTECIDSFNPITDSGYCEFPKDVLDYKKINAALDEYWGITIALK